VSAPRILDWIAARVAADRPMQDTTVLSGVVNDCVTRTVLGLACPGRRVCPHPVNGGHPVSRPIQNTPDGAEFRDGLVVMLTLSTGALDAVTFLCLGKVFSSVITGNLALLGVAAAQHDATLALKVAWPWLATRRASCWAASSSAPGTRPAGLAP
jgi:hypothetical protein